MTMKKTLSLLLALVMVLSLLAGCGTSTPAATPTENSTPANNSSAENPTEESHEPVTLHYYNSGWAGQKDADAVHAKVNDMIQEIYPWITVEFHISNSSDYATHVTLAQASGDPIDVLCSTMFDFATEVSNGSYMDITDYLGDYSALTSALPEWAYGYGIKDGRTYGFPNWQQCNSGNYSMAALKADADKYGLDVDKVNSLLQAEEFFNEEVYAEIEAFLAAARADGRDDVILLPGNNVVRNSPVARGYMQVWGPLYCKWSDESCQVINIYDIPEVQEYYEWIYDMKDKGYIPEDYYVNVNSYSGGTGIAAGYSPFYFNDNAYVPNFEHLRLTNWGADLYFMQAQKSKTEYYVNNSNAAGMTCVSATSKHPEDALRFVELLYTNEEIYNTLIYGLEGTHYTKNADGTIETLEYNSGDAPESASYGMAKWTVGNTKLAWVNQSSTVEFKTWALEELPATATVSPLLAFNFDTSSISSEVTQINAVLGEYEKQLFMTGATDWQATYAEFMNKLDASGLATVQEVLQEQVDAYIAGK